MVILDIQQLVPTGKALGWLAGAGISMFLAGMGFVMQFGEYRTLPQDVNALEQAVGINSKDIQALSDSVSFTARELRRIRCLSRLAATGQTVNPLSIDEVCP